VAFERGEDITFGNLSFLGVRASFRDLAVDVELVYVETPDGGFLSNESCQLVESCDVVRFANVGDFGALANISTACQGKIVVTKVNNLADDTMGTLHVDFANVQRGTCADLGRVSNVTKRILLIDRWCNSILIGSSLVVN
jgi:hypothetical protein